MGNSGFFRLGLGFSIALFCCSTAYSQNAPGSALDQLSSAFSGGQAVQQVTLSGDAAWYAGGIQYSGSATLTASVSGNAQLQLSLNTLGSRTEGQSGLGENATCQWSGSDGVAKAVSANNCWRPALWFLPALTLQPNALVSQLQLTDLGKGPVGADGNTYRHLRSQLAFADLPVSMSTSIAQQSVTDLGLDMNTMLPAVLTYTVLPDSGGFTPLAIEVRYSNYHTVNGVSIPFHIQRFVNGSLQLDLNIGSAQVN